MRNMRAFFIIGLFSASALAQHSDIEVVVESGALEVEMSDEGIFVFEGEFSEDLNPANFVAEPGFEVDDGMMQPGDDLAFEIVHDLLYWDGAQFGSVPAGHSLEIAKSIFSTTLDGSGDAGSGFVFGEADAGGGLHEDMDFTLGGPGAPGGLTPGAYGLWMRLTSPQYDTSNEFIIMLNYQLDAEDFEAGVDAAAAFVPEPVSGLGLLLGFGMLSRRR